VGIMKRNSLLDFQADLDQSVEEISKRH